MTRMEKIFVGLGAGTAGLLAVGFGMVALHGPYNGDAPKAGGDTSKPAAQSAAAAANAPARPAREVAPVVYRAEDAPALVKLHYLPPNAPSIPDNYLEQLSLAVNLADAPVKPPDKTEWKEVLPYAQKLMDGPCDCAQKVWLKHFIEMGNFALTDSDRQYHETASLLATLGRNDDQAMELSKRGK